MKPKNVQVIPMQDHDCGTHSLKKGVESTMALPHALQLEEQGIVTIKNWERPLSPMEAMEKRMADVEARLAAVEAGMKKPKATA